MPVLMLDCMSALLPFPHFSGVLASLPHRLASVSFDYLGAFDISNGGSYLASSYSFPDQ